MIQGSKEKLEMLISAIRNLGWDICFFEEEDEEYITGMVIGNGEFIDKVVRGSPYDAKTVHMKNKGYFDA